MIDLSDNTLFLIYFVLKADNKRLAKEEKEALKAHEKDAIAEVKKTHCRIQIEKG